ncbi:hypothetical protein HDZ31DRAFT_83798 [Schizophyllum fasciatum]
MGKTTSTKTRQTIRQQPSRGAKQRVAGEQQAHAVKRAVRSEQSQHRAIAGSHRARRPRPPVVGPTAETDPATLGLPPNSAALLDAFNHMYATMSGTLAEGQQPATYSSAYSYLPKHLRIEKGTVIPQGMPLPSCGGTVFNCRYSEEVVEQLLIAECGSAEEGMKQLKHLYENAEMTGGLPDPEDETIQHITLPGLSFHVRLWLGHQKTFVSFDLCDNETEQPVPQDKNLTIFAMRSHNSLQADQILSVEDCHHYDVPVPYNTFVVPEGALLDFRWKGKSIARVEMPTRERPSQPTQPATGFQMLGKSPLQFLAERTGNPRIAEMARR